MAKLNVEIAHQDERGEIIDLLENEIINAVTLVTFRAGAIRGNHYHKETRQWNYLISGSIKFVSQVSNEPVVESLMKPGDFMVTDPNVRHALVALEDSELMVFTKGPRGGKEYESDTYRLETPIASAPK